MSRRTIPITTAILIMAGLILAHSFAHSAGGDVEVAPPRAADITAIRRPIQVTTHTGKDLSPAFSKAVSGILYVSDRDGNQDVWFRGAGGYPPVEVNLTKHPSEDTMPAWSADGRRVAFISTRSDPNGDLYVMEVDTKSLAEAAGTVSAVRALKRVTGIETSDREPSWLPDLNEVILASADPRGRDYNLWRIDLRSGNRVQLTRDGGISPAASPDGRYVAFTSMKEDDKGDIWLLRLADARQIKLTEGWTMDGFPAWYQDGRFIFFTRYSEDTDRDGSITTADNPSIWKIILDADPFQPGGKLPKAVQLTSSRFYDIFPAAEGDRVLFSSNRSGPVNIWAVGLEGEIAEAGSAKLQLQLADELGGLPDVHPSLLLLAYERVEQGFRDSADPSLIAEARYKAARIHLSSGAISQAETIFGSIVRDYGGLEPYGGLSRVELLKIEASRVSRRNEEAHKKRIMEICDELNRLAEEHEASPPVASTALIARGDLLMSVREPLSALESYDLALRKYQDQRPLAARAAFSKGEVYALLGQPDELIEAYEGVLKEYSDQREWAEKAAEEIIELIAGGRGTAEERINLLHQIAADYAPLHVLPPLALNKMGDLLLEEGEKDRAAEAYRRVTESYPQEVDQAVKAWASLADIYSRSGDYQKVLEIYGLLQERYGRDREIYHLARESYIKSALAKAQKELEEKEPKLALKTYLRLIEYDFDVIEAHRGLVETYASLREVQKAVDFYRDRTAREGKGFASLYALGLAYTYITPPRLTEAMENIKESLSFNSQIPYSHQTLGWVYEQMEELEKGKQYLERALDEYRTALFLTDKDENPRGYADLLLNTGNACFRIENYDGAYHYYSMRAESGVPFRNEMRESIFHEQFGRASFKLGRYGEAERHYLKALEIIGEGGEPERLASLREKLGLSYQEMGEHLKAAEEFALSLKINLKAGASSQIPRLRRNVAYNLYHGSRSPDGGVDYQKLESALNGYLESLKGLGEPLPAPAKKKKGLFTIRREISLSGEGEGAFDRQGEERLIYTYLGRIFEDMGDYARAVEFLNNRLKLYPEEKKDGGTATRTERAVILNQIGNLYYRMGDYEAALRYFALSDELCRKLDNLYGTLINLSNSAKIMAEIPLEAVTEDELSATIGAVDEGIERGKKARSPENDPLVAELLITSGLLHHRVAAVDRAEGDKVGSPKESLRESLSSLKSSYQEEAAARKRFEEALDLLKEADIAPLRKARLEIMARNNAASAAALLGLKDDALAHLEASLSISRRDNLPDLEWKILYQLYRLDEANGLRHIEAATGLLETFPPQTIYQYGSSSEFALSDAVYGEAVATHLRNGEVMKALDYSERRAASLARFSSMPPLRFSSPQIQEVYDLYKGAADAVIQLISPPEGQLRVGKGSNEETASDAARLKKALEGYAGAKEELRKLSPPLSLLLGVNGRDMNEVQAAVEEDAVLLHFFASGDLAAVWAITRGDIQERSSKIDGRRLRTIIRNLAGDPLSYSEDDVEYLSSTFINPVEDILSGKERIYIAADPYLLSLPWPALKIGGAPIVQKFQLAFLGSASQISSIHQERSPFKRNMLWVAESGPGVGNGGLIKAGAEGPSTDIVSFNRDALFEEASRHDIIRLGGRVRFDPESPLESRIAFDEAPVPSEALQAGELLRVKGKGTLLIMADGLAMEKTRPNLPPPLSPILQAAAVAGFPAVLFNLAEADPDYNRQLMETFHRLLARHPPAEALSLSQAEMIRLKPGSRSWSGYRLYGHPGMNEAETFQYAEAHLEEALTAGTAAFGEGKWEEAAAHLQDALSLLNFMGIADYLDQVYETLAQAYYGASDLRKAVEYQTKLVELRMGAGGGVPAADALHTLGVIHSNAEDYEEAAKSLQSALELYRQTGSAGKEAQSFTALGVVEENFNRYEKALESFRDALRLKDDLNDRIGAAEQLRKIGRIEYLRLNNYYEAEKRFREALGIFRQAGDERLAVQTLMEIGLAREKMGDLSSAMELYKEAGEKAGGLGDDLARAQAENYIGNICWHHGDYQNAFKHEKESLRIAEELGDKRQQIFAQNTLGLIYWTLNDHSRALRHLNASLDLAREARSRLDEASALNNIGLVHRQQGNYEESLKYFEEALSIDQEIKSRWGIGYDHRNMGMSYLHMGRLDEARGHLLKAVEISGEIGDRVNLIKALYSLGSVHLMEKDLPGAEAHSQSALSGARELDLPEVEWRSLWGRGRVELERGNIKEALALLKEAVEVVERIRGKIKIEEFSDGFLEDKLELYDDTILTLLRQGELEEALLYAERARSRNFIDLLANQKIDLRDDVSEELLQRLNRVRDRIRAVKESLRWAEGEERNKLEGEIKELNETHADIMIEIRAKKPQLSSFVTVDPVAPQELQGLLEEGVALLEYYTTRDRLLIWVIRKGGIQLASADVGRSDLERKVRSYRDLIQKIAPLEAESEELYHLLISPVESYISGVGYLGIIPHGPLHYLSFSSLRSGGTYLVDRYPIFYSPSASVLKWTFGKRRDGKGDHRVLAVGNPDLEDFNYDLPLAEKEAESLKWDFPEVTILTRERAKESWITENVDKYDIIHFATHGEFDSVNPLFSSIKLVRDMKADGSLEVLEIFPLRLNADLVTLSACQTGLGRVTRGDEIMGLNRAFVYAGTHTLVSSLWRVSDLSTALLIKHFYRYYQHYDKAESLRRAQLEVRERFPHPTYWAGFNLTGDYK